MARGCTLPLLVVPSNTDLAGGLLAVGTAAQAKSAFSHDPRGPVSSHGPVCCLPRDRTGRTSFHSDSHPPQFRPPVSQLGHIMAGPSLQGRPLVLTVSVLTSLGFMLIGYDNGLMGGLGEFSLRPIHNQL